MIITDDDDNDNDNDNDKGDGPGESAATIMARIITLMIFCFSCRHLIEV